MLKLPEGEENYQLRLMGVDPGSDTLGLSSVEVNLNTGAVSLMMASTFHGSKMVRDIPHVLEVHGARTARLWAHQQNLERRFRLHMPDELHSESPYLGRFPQAFATLTECMTAIRRAVYLYDPLMPLVTVDPPTVKQVVGVTKKGSTKDDVREGLLKVKWLDNPNDIDISKLDEHSVDAICVALVRAKKLRDSILNPAGTLV